MNQLNHLQLRTDVLLALQVALLGLVTPNIRGITVKYDDQRINGLFVYGQSPSSADLERVSEVESELCAHFPNHEVQIHTKQCVLPEDLNAEILADWVYRRYEEHPGIQ